MAQPASARSKTDCQGLVGGRNSADGEDVCSAGTPWVNCFFGRSVGLCSGALPNARAQFQHTDSNSTSAAQ